MAIIKCEKVFAGIWIFSSLFKKSIFTPHYVQCENTFILIENELEKLKISAKSFSTCIVSFSLTLII